MESLMSAFADGDWDLCDKNFLNDDADFMLHQLFDDEVGEGSSSSSVAPATWSFIENDTNLTHVSQSFFHPMGSIFTDLNHLSTEYGFGSHREVGMFPQQLSNTNVPSEYYTTNGVTSPVHFFSSTLPEDGYMAGLEPSRVEPDILISVPNTPLSLKRRLDVTTYGQHKSMSSEIPNKKTRTMRNVCGNKTNTLSKKNRQMSVEDGCDNVEAINYTKQMQSYSYSSEDDSNASQELNTGTSVETKPVATSHDKNGKKKGRRGTAIDPQSLYARKRRERINERLRILQNLVPNGTKVDISTMLEEAVSYVKFLQTQIKLLSSDDLWMYAPIAYNGVDVGLDRRLSQNL